MEEQKIRSPQNESRNNSNSVVDIGRRKGYLVEQKVDYGYGIIDILWKISIHPSLPKIRIGFIETDNWQDNQYNIGVIEEALMRGAEWIESIS
jgi:hypothetical protein